MKVANKIDLVSEIQRYNAELHMPGQSILSGWQSLKIIYT